MGGKHKQANRTKNNTRPSNSSHSAELLGNTIPTFFGFSTVKNGASAVPSFQTEDASCSINSDFQVLFKQMNKKDPTTRFKALQLFIELVNRLDIEAVKAVLPIWSRMYCLLCTDVNHKVRENSHKAHRAIVSKVKKLIAPFLKELAGPWFTSQYDTYAPAASAATQCFEEAFPSSKLNKAIIFCQEEILSYIYDNLIDQTPQSLSNPVTTSPEDMQAKYERIVLASLQGYTLYLQKLSSNQIQEAVNENNRLLSHPKFWKHAKSKVSVIRTSFYNCIISICQNAKFLLVGQSAHLNSAIFNNLDETDAIVLHSVWDAALHVLVSVEDCWLQVNIEKQLFTKLYKILKGGGRNVLTIYPNILPLLSKLPEDLIKDKDAFYRNLFDNMKCGLEVVSFNQSSSEGKILATTFIECFKFVIKQNSTNEEFCSSLLSNQLMPIFDKLLEGKVRETVKLPFLVETACLVHYWHANGSNKTSVYDQLINNFFLSLLSLFENQLNSEVTRNSITNVLDNQVQIINILLHPDQLKQNKKSHVKFKENIEPIEIQTLSTESHGFDVSECPNELTLFIKKLVGIYFKNAIDKVEKSYVVVLAKLLHLFDTEAIFEEMTRAVKESTTFKLFTSYFCKWLINEDMKCEEIVNLSFGLLRYVTYDEKEYILEELCNNWLDDSLRFSFCRVLPFYSHDNTIMNWVRSEKFLENLIDLVERFINGVAEYSKSRDVIIMLLKAKRTNEEFIIDAATTSLIIDALNRRLEGPNEKSEALELSQDLILNVEGVQLSQPSILALVASLFKLSCSKIDNEKLFQACKTGLSLMLSAPHLQTSDLEITEKLSEVVKEIIINDKMTEYSLQQIIANIDAYLDLATHKNTSEPLSSSQKTKKIVEIIAEFLRRDRNNDTWSDEAIKMMKKCCHVGYEGNEFLDYEYLEQEKYLNFMCCPRPWEKSFTFDLSVIMTYLKWNLYTGRVLNLILARKLKRWQTQSSKNMDSCKTIEDSNLHESNDMITTKISKENEAKLQDDLDETESITEKNIHKLLKDICDFFMAVGFFDCFNKYHASTKYYLELKSDSTELKCIAVDILKNANASEFELIYNHCKTTFRERSVWWIIEPVFKETFARKVAYAKSDDCLDSTNRLENCFEQFEKITVSKLPIYRGHYLMILFLIENEYAHRLTEEQWDGIFIYMHNFLEELVKKSHFSQNNLLILLAVSRLYLKLKNLFKNNHLKPSELRILPETCLAWNEVVQTEMYNKFTLVWRKLTADWYNQKDIPPEWITVLQNVCEVVLDGLQMRKSEKVNESLNLALECTKWMKSPHAVIQITSFRMCNSTIPDLVKTDTEMFGDNMSRMFQDGKKESSMNKKTTNEEWTIKNFQGEIVDNQGIVEILLSDLIIGDYCTVEPFTDSFTYTYTYLLIWCFLLEACGEAHSSLREQYGSWLQEAGYTTVLLKSIFKLMPQEVLHGSKTNEDCQKYFESFELLDFRKPINGKLIQQMACLVYRLFLQRLPNCIREWWKQTENKTFSLVDKVTKLYVSPILIANELKNVQQDRETGFDNIEVKIYPGAREVAATYTIDEVKMDLIMTLPPNYPLGTVKIDSSNVVVGTPKWRNLLFQISKYLIHQNGTIWDALIIWKNNLDKKFEGVEECYICFSILQGSSFEIPKLCCHTCKKKFHSNCLYKWFSTSNKSTCPICRNLF